MQQLSPKKPRLEEPQNITLTPTDPFFQCADLILPWLTPQELGAVSLTCKTLCLICKSITLRRSIDAARSLENLPVPFCNAVDSHRYAYFLYSPCQVLASSSPASSSPQQRWGDESGVTGGDPVSRPCPDSGNGSPDLPNSGSDSVCALNDSGRSADSASSRRILDSSGGLGMGGCGCVKCDERYCPCFALAGLEIAKECGSGCGCGLDCPNRVTQKGISIRLKIVRDKKKGWCLFADEFIKQDQFVCEYAGELLTTEEARRRQKTYDKLRSTGFSSALLVVREHLPSGQACLRINIDATRTGNIARFINHSCCGGNLSTVLLRSSGALLPRLCFFASRDINPDEELSFSYGDVRVRAEEGLKCFCGSSCCYGTLPCENT